MIVKPFKTYKRTQFLAAYTATISAISDGMQYSWAAPIIPILQSADSKIKITETDVMWLQNMYSVGGGIGLITAIFTVKRFGCKISILMSAVLSLLAWMMIALMVSVECLYVARFFCGVASEMVYVSAPMYVGEISDKEVRGFLSSLLPMNLIFGIIVMFCIGPFVPIYISSAVGSIPIIIQLICFSFMPDSPYYSLSKNKVETATKNLQKLRQTDDVDAELEQISSNIAKEQADGGRVIDLFLLKGCRKALLILAVINCSVHFCGFTAVVMNIHSILESAGSPVAPSAAAIIFSSLMLASIIFTSPLIDRAGRKMMLILSSVITTLLLFVFASYFTIQLYIPAVTEYNWIPLISMMIYGMAYRCGFGTVSVVLTAELFPSNVKVIGITISDALYVIFSFLSIYIYQTFRVSYGIHVPFFIFGFWCIFSIAFILFYLPETKGKSLEEIQKILKGNVPNTKSAEIHLEALKGKETTNH
ncbi:hypothetical protein PPYR_12082 [Photinus pyralis]|uniref:Major facilitator superfamily (MFS) profile domain-containing protein n=1 Tax=Photinus pyralis TaxID=7054 RepID=A0A1Y1KC24_PHOPY|nr:facilitated trehalose transporter Tret1-like [Photinus pyralis]XP_031352128.1 facilitated trehalose transporter Tret1-like [Photinus pyralis]KAB0795210.1 hypothetical protein PPYR_12049 [Photinus pyralis]KAB0795243.1 hypothetical protein PPYR_12082 [Photinus pyralis]